MVKQDQLKHNPNSVIVTIPEKRNIIIAIITQMCFLQATFAQGDSVSALYDKAYMEMADMLEGKKPISIRKAVFMAEWAYPDGNLDYDI